MHGASCLTQIEGYVYRCSYGNITTNTKSSRVCTLWLITLFNLLLCCNIPTNVEANDIQLSGLSQSPSNPVSEGTSVSYSLTTRNVDDGINESSSVGISIRMRVDGAVIRADSGDIEAAGCSIDQNYPDYFACNDLLEGGTQTPSFTWSNPSPGNHSVVFEAACQWIPAQTPPAYCTSFGTSISTSTTIGAYPISNAGSGSLITLDAGANDALDVTLDGSASSDPDGNIVTYQWLEGDNEIATGATPTLNLSAGDHRLTLRVTDNHGLSDDDSITYRILSDPTAHTTSQAFVESDGDGLENVTLDGSSSQDPGGNIVTYEWFESGTLIATGATPAIDLALGTHYITLRVTDNDGATNEAQAEITILPYPSTRFADAGPDQYLIDTDNDSSEIVQLDATGSGNYGNATYYWYEQTELVAVGITPRVTLPVGIHTLFLEVEVFTPDGELGANDGDEVTITVLAATEAPIANAGEDQTLTDADADGSEEVTLDATGSSYAAGNSVSYQWLENGTEIATGATPTVTLSVGSHTLTLRLTDSNNLSSEDQVV
ncbi:MAG: PKD domain-containing protein, partial [Candidatus Thiodiazotropha sp.]